MTPKFRAFYNGNMFEVTAILWRNGKIEYIRGILPNGEMIGGHKDSMDISKIKLMWFTGFPDKNGKKICQGDIIKYSWRHFGTKELMTEYLEVKFGKYVDIEGFYTKHHWGWFCGDDTLIDIAEKSEVIGNIHENPELLEAHNENNQ